MTEGRGGFARSLLSSRSIAVLLFLVGIVVSALPIVSFPYIPTQDGAAHYNLAAAIAGLGSTERTFFSQYFEFRPLHLSNQLAARLMMWTGDFGDGARAERIAWTVIFAAFSAVVVANLWAIRREAVVLSLMFFPVFSGALVDYGFMNYVIGVILFIQSAFLLQSGLYRPSIKWIVGLVVASAATYVAHPIAGFILAATIGPFGLAYVVRWWTAGREQPSASFSKQVPIGCALACAVLAVLAAYDALPQIVDLFMSMGQVASGGHTALPAGVEDSWRQRLIDVFGLSYFVNHSPADYLFSLLFALVIGWLGARRLLEFRRAPRWRAEDAWLASALPLLVLSLVMPRSMDYFLPERLSACLILILLLWLSASRLNPRASLALLITGLLLNTGLCAWRLQWSASVNTILEEYASVAPFIADKTSVISITTSPSYLQLNCQAVRARVLPCRFKPTLHFLGELLGGRPVALLTNYQLRAASGFFPITLRAPWDRYARYMGDFERWPPSRDAPGLTVANGAAALIKSDPPDVVVTWDERIATGATTGLFPDAVAPLLGDYTRVFTSAPLGAASVYLRRRP